MPLIVSKTRKVQHSKPLITIEVQKSWSQVVKANPYKDPSTGRFTTGGGISVTTTGAGKVNIYNSKRDNEIDDERSAAWKERSQLQEKYEGLRPSASSKYSPEDEAKWNELNKLEDDLWEERVALQREYFDNSIEMKSGKSAADSDFGFNDERLDVIRDEYVVPDELTLKTNAGLRRTGRVTTKVQRFDEMVEQGTITSPMRVHRGAILSPEQVGKLEVGTSFVDKGFQSVAMDSGGAQAYLDIRANKITGEKVLFEYDLQKGTNAVNVGYGEIVVQRSAKVTITGVTKQGDMTIVKAEVSKG